MASEDPPSGETGSFLRIAQSLAIFTPALSRRRREGSQGFPAYSQVLPRRSPGGQAAPFRRYLRTVHLRYTDLWAYALGLCPVGAAHAGARALRVATEIGPSHHPWGLAASSCPPDAWRMVSEDSPAWKRLRISSSETCAALPLHHSFRPEEEAKPLKVCAGIPFTFRAIGYLLEGSTGSLSC